MKSANVELGEVCSFLSGFSFKAELFSSEPIGLPLIRIRDVLPGRSNTYYSGPYQSEYLVQKGDILIGMDGEFNRERWKSDPALLNQRVCKPIAKSDVLDDGYLYHVLPLILKRIEDETPFVTVKHLSVAKLRGAHIPLPPLEEQRRIAAILDKASTLKQQSAKASSITENLGIARLEQLLARNVHLLTSRRLEELCAAGAPITYGILQPGPDLDEGVPYVRPSEIKNSQVDLNRLKKTSPEIARKYSKSELKSGDILLTIVGTIGETAVVPPELEGGNITQSSARIRVNPRLASPAFIYHFLKSQHAKRQIDRDRLGVAVERLNLHHVRDMEILCPPLEIQEKFAAEAQSMANIAYRHSLLACSASSLFNSLSNSLFAGNQGQ